MSSQIEVSAHGSTAVPLYFPSEKLSSPQLPVSKNQFRIAVIDDEPSAVKLLSLILSDYQVVTFTKVEEFEKSFLIDEYHMILTDQKMPGKTGTELAKFIRTKNMNIPIVVVTGHGIDSQSQVELHIMAVVMKPFTDQDILSIVGQGYLRQEKKIGGDGRT